MSLKQQATKSILWSAIERFSTQGMQFVFTIVIARILVPEDYALVAMLGIFMALSQLLIDSGFGNALIQKQNRSQIDYSTVFYFNFAFSAFIYLLLYISAPFIADFYEQPLLQKVLRIYGLNLIIRSLAIVQQTHLTIHLDFKRQALVSLVAVAVSGIVGVVMAYYDMGVWALVWQALSCSICWVAGLWLLSRWFPVWAFSMQSFRGLFSFGSKLMLADALHTFYVNMYSLVIGKVFPASTLGYFNRAYTLGQFPVQNFTNIFFRVIYPVQCRYQNDDAKFRFIFMAYTKLSSFIIFPLMLGMASLASPLISLLLTDKWLPIVPLLQIICLSMLWDPIRRINCSALDAKGRSDYRLYSEIWKKTAAFIILFASIPFGIEVVCWGLLLYALIDVAIIAVYSRKVTDIGLWWQIKAIFPILALSLVMAFFVYFLTCLIDIRWLQLLAGTCAGILFYIGAAYLMKWKEIRFLWALLVDRKSFNIEELDL